MDPTASDPTAPASTATTSPHPTVPVLAPAVPVVRVATVVAAPAPALADAPSTAPLAAALGAVHATGQPSLSPRIAAASPRALLAAGASAGLLPFAPRATRGHHGAAAFDLGLDLGAVIYAPQQAGVAATAGGAPDAARRLPRSPARHSGGGTPPVGPAPHGPPGNAGAGGLAGPSGGVASAVWCALLAGGLILLVQQFRRHRFRLVVPAPRGVVLLLHRPG
jgi:hypothetical protein